ncbi:hypothetical protein [Salinibacterium xinjiangense]|nr:hypothetical protein [Salinibacterium xinjiangense]
MASLVTSGELPELKRLFVYDSARGSGVAGRLLDAIENQARDAAAAVDRGGRALRKARLPSHPALRRLRRFGLERLHGAGALEAPALAPLCGRRLCRCADGALVFAPLPGALDQIVEHRQHHECEQRG